MRKNYERKKVIGLFFKISEKCQYIVYFENKGNQSCLYTCCWCMMCTVCCTFVFVWISPVWLFCLCPFSVLALKDLFFFFFLNHLDFHLLTLSYPMVMIFIFWLWATQWLWFSSFDFELPNEGYSRNVSCTLNLISMFLSIWSSNWTLHFYDLVGFFFSLFYVFGQSFSILSLN